MRNFHAPSPYPSCHTHTSLRCDGQSFIVPQLGPPRLSRFGFVADSLDLACGFSDRTLLSPTTDLSTFLWSSLTFTLPRCACRCSAAFDIELRLLYHRSPFDLRSLDPSHAMPLTSSTPYCRCCSLLIDSFGFAAALYRSVSDSISPRFPKFTTTRRLVVRHKPTPALSPSRLANSVVPVEIAAPASPRP